MAARGYTVGDVLAHMEIPLPDEDDFSEDEFGGYLTRFCVQAYMCINVRGLQHINVCACIHVHVCVCVYMYVCVCACVRMCVCACVCVCVRVCV